jgi:hypothetical protein
VCRKVLSIDEYAAYFPDIDPLAPFKPGVMNKTCDKRHASKLVHPTYDVSSDRVKGVFVISDPVDWSRDIQVILSTFYNLSESLFISSN